MSELEQLWQRISDDFDRDETLDADEYLDKKIGASARLRESLADSVADLLEQTFDGGDSAERLNLSRYEIRERINSGGQSEVYRAERSDGVYRKTVIIKFISRRHSHAVLRPQLLQEMQLLADLNHPGIVNILDGGLTDSDQPWLVLDFVDGEHLDDYCRLNGLDTREVVKLFIQLCDALQFIHLRGVIHMDLKAANVLVKEIDGVSWPVIIDFGIALEAAALKRDEQRPVFGTPGFSAPEQLAGQVVDKRADVYSIGMLLAQILVGRNTENIGLLTHDEREAELKSQSVSRDLVQIIRKSTSRRPDHRYPDADTLRTDLNNWLNDFPLIANRNLVGHVMAKTIRRHKVISVASIILLVLAVSAAYKYTFDVKELQTLTRAEKNSSDALYNFMLTDLFDQLTKIGRVDALESIAERSLVQLQSQDPRTFDNASWLQSAIAYTNAGKVFDALESTDQALSSYALAEKNLAEIERVPELRRDYLRQWAELNVLRSLVLTTSQQRELTEQSLAQAITAARELMTTFPDEPPDLLWEAHLQSGWHFMEYNQPDQARAHIDQALELAMPLAAPGSLKRPDWMLKLSHSWQASAWYEFDYGTAVNAARDIDRALELSRATLAKDDEDIEYLDNYRILLNQQSYFHSSAGRSRSAQESIDEAIRVGRQLQLMAPNSRKYQRELAYSYSTGGEIAEQAGDLEAALAYYRQGLEISSAIAQADSDGFSSSNDHALDLISTANVLNRLGYEQEARSHWSQAAEVMSSIQQQEPGNKYYSFTLAVALIQLGRYEEAMPLVHAIRHSGMDDEEFNDLLIRHGLE